MLEVIGGIRVPTCDCLPNTRGENCQILSCGANPCCGSGPNPELCCQNGVCSNENYVFAGDAITNNTDECQCLCTNNFSGLFKYSYQIKMFQ